MSRRSLLAVGRLLKSPCVARILCLALTVGVFGLSAAREYKTDPPRSPAKEPTPEAPKSAGRVVVTGSRLTRGEVTADAWRQTAFSNIFGPLVSGAIGGEGAASVPTSEQSTGNKDDNNKETCSPVAVSTGEKMLAHTDFVHDSLLPLSLRREFRSRHYRGRQFGGRWTASLDQPALEYEGPASIHEGYEHMGPMPVALRVIFPRGGVYRYAMVEPGLFRPSGSLTGHSLIGELVKAPQSWHLSQGGHVYRYGSTNQYLNLLDVRENGQVIYTFNYNANGLLTSTSNAYGQVVGFTWTGWRVTRVTAPGGLQWNYGYDTGGNLNSVTPPAGAGPVIQYH